MKSAEFTFADCLHNDIRCNDSSFITVTNKHTGIAVFIDQTWCSVSSIEDRLNRCIFKDGLVTASPFQLL